MLKISEKLHKPAKFALNFTADIDIYAIAPCCHQWLQLADWGSFR